MAEDSYSASRLVEALADALREDPTLGPVYVGSNEPRDETVTLELPDGTTRKGRFRNLPPTPGRPWTLTVEWDER